MLYSLSGKVVGVLKNGLVVGVGGVGFKIFVPRRVRAPRPGSKIKLFTYLYIRGETVELYGFGEEKELELFELLVSVSGIGPKLALGILSVAPSTRITSAIKSGEVEILRKSSGIGEKMAERLIIELKGKLGRPPGRAAQLIAIDSDIFEALVGLGYKKSEAKAVIEKIDPHLKTLKERLRDALKKIK